MNLNVAIQGQGYPILCLHGHPGSSKTMSVFTDVLSQSYQTIAPDLRGYGESPARGKFQMRDHLDDLQRLLDRYQIEQCLVLGWSLGGILGLELTLQNPDRFSGLIMVASAAYPWSNHPKTSAIELINTGISGIINYFKPGWQWNIDTLGKRSLFKYLVYQQTSQAYQYLGKQAVPAFFKTSLAANKALSEELSNGYNRLSDLEQIDIPCLVLAGECDRHITAQSSAKTAKHLKNCQYICYRDTAHLFPWEIPQIVTKDIQHWLNNVDSIRPKN
ncbi:putative hydrolase or acyltransferase of alpha/beta superfamily [Hyella patelloides LEGE 07179]|uniref:Putative hydrolase or acyltransferase of alpha/beta superfamily n=1 Tax=Hyella patelloides LEGE 07179 TaxID=945734 RepID=A0A563W594_9CYAN|nr:alpha/beta hydrolase [Hyella patelloides]VEP18872.1 putative hydrolase or acyltransferase of alpha/beta superfamily [Hyella patelloides LEGE 07179]